MADSGELARRPAHALAAAVARKEVSSRELVDTFLDRIDSHNPTLNAVVTVDPDGARRAADAADAAVVRGVVTGPLHGVPMTIKDTYQTRGMRTTCGVPAWDHIPDTDADAVRRLRDAGAIVIGKTNTPAYAGDWQSYNPIFGATNNPWDTARTPGGSSGGAAAAVAAGLTALELGSDIAGSIRVPSNWCGVYGHKPSWGVVPQRGHLPPAPGVLSSSDLAVCGPIARCVADLQLALGILAGPDDAAAVGWRLDLPPARASTLSQLRLVAWLDDPAYPVEPEVGDFLQAAVATMVDAGAQLIDVKPPVALPEIVALHQKLLYPLIQPSATMRHRSWLVANEERQQVRARMSEFFRDVDVLVMPVTVVPAIEHDHSEPFTERTIAVAGGTRSYLDLFGWVGLPTVAYLPATAVPVGRTATGLPVGMQIAGEYLHDRTTLAVAHCVEELLG